MKIARFSDIVLAALIVSQCSLVTAGELIRIGPSLTGSADLNGDGQTDLVMVDPRTGILQAALADPAWQFRWLTPYETGLADINAGATGGWGSPDRDSLALLSESGNRVITIDWPGSDETARATNVAIWGVAPHELAVLGADPQELAIAAPFLEPASPDGLEWLRSEAGSLNMVARFPWEKRFARMKGVHLGASWPYAISTLHRGTQDEFRLYSLTVSSADLLLSISNLTHGIEYELNSSGTQVLFYLQGQSNAWFYSLSLSNSVGISETQGLVFDKPIWNVAHLSEGDDGHWLVLFGNGASGQLPEAGGLIGGIYRYGSGNLHLAHTLQPAPGAILQGVLPLSSNLFAALSAPTNEAGSHTIQVFRSSPDKLEEISSTSIPRPTAPSAWANVWLFVEEPFVSFQPRLLGSLDGGDWTERIDHAQGRVTAVIATDRGTQEGLGKGTPQDLGPAPAQARFALPNQVHPAISIFSYAPPSPIQSLSVRIAPPPGSYSSPITVTFNPDNPTDRVHYQLGESNAWSTYGIPLLLNASATVRYFAEDISRQYRTPIFTAHYQLPVLPQHPNGTNTPATNHNTVPGLTNIGGLLARSDAGVVIYGRRSDISATIWLASLDGAFDQMITTGIRPRLSPDTRYLAFLRENDASGGQGALWIRDMISGEERSVLEQPGDVTGYAWQPNNTNLLFDWNCGISQMDLSGRHQTWLQSADCSDDAPEVNPVDGTLVFHNLTPAHQGVYVAAADGSGRRRLFEQRGASWPAWSPDGQWIAYVDGNQSNSFHRGKDLWTIKIDGTSSNAITGLSRESDGFRHGALWAPNGDALIGAATIDGVNGIYRIPLSLDRTHCEGLPERLTISSGDPVDYVGTVIPGLVRPELLIRLNGDQTIVYWRSELTGYILEQTESAITPDWKAVNGPFTASGKFLEYPMTNSSVRHLFFRLRR